ncbi:MAG: carboxypeptidase-like regulatory domain-containing protein [Thermoplasmata archaeon]|nr:MAG: carboxypeptidase-like regulatory domain-containing protein [Thermoplasmata archaeon]
MTDNNNTKKDDTKGGKSHNGPPTEIHHHYYYKAPRVKKKHSSKPYIIGAMLFLTAVIGLAAGSMALVGGVFLGTSDGGFGPWDDGAADVTGRVTFLNGTGVEDATVSIVNSDLSTQTDAEGYYILYDTPTGNQELKVEYEGYNTYIRKVFITPHSEVEWDVESEEFKNENNYDFVISEGDQTIERGEESPWGEIGGILIVCAVLLIVFSVVALIGGIYAVNRKKFNVVLAGSILGIFTLVGAIFALIALFILIMSKDEFKRSEN